MRITRRAAGALALGLACVPAAAQGVPGRDLLQFPLGLVAEAPALSSLGALGLWNPASVALSAHRRWRYSGGTMTAPVDVGASAQLLTVARRVGEHTTAAFSLVHASVADLSRTESDPQSLGNIRYGTTMVSAILTRTVGPVTIGAAARRRSGALANAGSATMAGDLGLTTRGFFGRRDLRAGVGSLLAASTTAGERATYSAAADGRVVGVDTTRELRAGWSVSRTVGATSERYPFLSARWQWLEARAGWLHTVAFGRANDRLRAAIAVHRADYAVGVMREESAGGLGATYHFTMRVLRQ
ncbi:MAG: hypothetical protein K2X99_02240 [Gemmatimonadaceae bacterium]|nr:hypothetical protein [Gemmatimonadaceae bacterium]